MNQIAAGLGYAGGMFVGMLVLMEAGRRIRRRDHRRHGEAVGSGLGATEGAVFGLMGLLLAFTFSGAASRFSERRHLVIDEANAIGTAYLRLDLLAAEPRRELQQELREYVDARLAIYRAAPDAARVRAALAHLAELQGRIWVRSTAAVHEAALPTVAAQLLPALGQMFDISTTRMALTKIHPPPIVYVLLGVVSLLCAALAGYAMGANPSRNWLHMFGLAAILSVTLYVIVDLEYPRLGLFKIAEFDQLLLDVRETMR